MRRSFSHAIALGSLLPVVALLSVACSGAAESDRSATETTSVGSIATGSTTPGGPVAASGTTVTVELCGDRQLPHGLDFTVVDIPGDDPDGGLVGASGAGTAYEHVTIFPAGTALSATSDPADCAISSDGAVWWYVGSDDTQAWVNSRYLVQSDEQAEANRADVCDLYVDVLDYENAPDFAPAALTSELRGALNGPPPGVVAALEGISSPMDGAHLDESYAALTSYVGPICDGD